MAFATINYLSRSLNKASSFNIVFPDDPKVPRPWAVFYLLHGLSDDHTIWMRRTSIERSLLEAGDSDFRFVIIGAGSEKDWLAENMSHAEFPGVLKGEALAQAYADMDVFAFPSETDTFGNVILESLASGVPTVVTSGGGPKFLVNSGVTGFVSQNDEEFIGSIKQLMQSGQLLANMRQAARDYADSISWDTVFEKVYNAYELVLFRNTPLRAAC